MPGNAAATLFIGNLDERVDEKILHGIMIQAGPLVDVNIPRDKGTKKHKGYGFAEYITVESAEYAIRLFTGLLKLYGRSAKLAMASGAKKDEEDIRPPGTESPVAESEPQTPWQMQSGVAASTLWGSSTNPEPGYGTYGEPPTYGYVHGMYGARAPNERYYHEAAGYGASQPYHGVHQPHPPCG